MECRIASRIEASQNLDSGDEPGFLALPYEESKFLNLGKIIVAAGIAVPTFFRKLLGKKQAA